MIIIGLVVPAIAWSRTEARYELRTPDLTFGDDLYSSSSKQALFHQQTLNVRDNEAVNINFPLIADGIDAGATLAGAGSVVDGALLGAGATSNVLPFGLVNLAFPSISQTSDQAISASSTGFYTATFLGIPPINSGGSLIYADDAGSGYNSIGAPSSLVGSHMMFPEMNNIIPGYDKSKATAKKPAAGTSNNTTKGTGESGSTGGISLQGNASAKSNSSTPGQTAASIGLPASMNDSVIKAQVSSATQDNQSQGEHLSIAGQEVTGAASAVPLNYIGVNASNQMLSYPYFNFKAKAGGIRNNTSLVDRMWRNSHLGTMGRAYEGDTSRPAWMLQTDYTTSAIAMFNWTDVNGIALNQTIPGTHLIPRFWGLGITAPNNPTVSGLDKVNIGKRIARGTDNSSGTSGGGAGNISGTQGAGNVQKSGTGPGGNVSTTTPSGVSSGGITFGSPAGPAPAWKDRGQIQKGWMGGPWNPWVYGIPNAQS